MTIKLITDDRMSNEKYHNGPSVDCYGLPGNAKLNYNHGFCYESSAPATRIGKDVAEQRWHAVQHTFGIDFSDSDVGGVVVKADNSGNCYLGAFDPNCIGTNEKWKIHADNAFGTNQHEDILADKYNLGYQTHGTGAGTSSIPSDMNKVIIQSIQDKPMTWNLWNIIRQYVYINNFKNQNRSLSDGATWDELEKNTEKLVRSIYRTFKSNQMENDQRRKFDAVTSYGDICLVKWTNSFVEISSIFERNDRQHEASFVMFTGNQTYDYNSIKNSKDNFRINTLDGVDSDEDGIDGSFNGVKYDDLPITYTIGEDETYNQIQSQIDIDLDQQISLNAEYPFAENQYQNPELKWDRTISNVMMVNQIIPVYTSMETMTKTYRQVSVDELKSITFQVVPQFYWRYTQTYNEFMVHPVGKLNPNSMEMYDMLGNVWEWVRDDWGVNISSLNEKINPLFGKAEDSSQFKVIRGGSFDQFCRKVINSSREGLNINKCVSETGTQANVGFRPSMTYTQESVITGMEQSDAPLDVFFLFDASSSQNNQVNDMINSAKGILEELGKSNQNMKVGTALFLGPTIRFMCSNRAKTVSSTYLYKTYNTGTGKTQSDISKSVSNAKIQKQEKEGNGFSDINKVWNKLKQEFNNYKQSYYEQNESEQREQSQTSQMLSRGSDDIGVTIGSTHYGSSNSYPYYFATSIQRHLDIHTGVDYFNADGTVSSNVQKNFYTYDLNDRNNFVWPFLKTSSGVLSNWWAGCEPVTFILSKLLGSGYFDGEPYARFQGYVFRKNSKKLIFVYTNEYDNSMWRQVSYSISENTYNYTVKENEVVSIPCNTVHKNRIDLHPMKIQYTDIFGAKQYDQNPPDPYCFQVLRGSGAFQKILDYVKEIGLDLDEQYNSKSIDSISEQCGMFSDLGLLKYEVGSEGMEKFTTSHNSVNSVSSTYDIQNREPTAVFSGVNSYQKIVDNFLTQEQVNLFKNTNKSNLTINGITFTNQNKYRYVSYEQLNTVGFYELRNVLSKKNDKTNVYLMVSDANAPVLNKDDTGIHLFQDYRMFRDIWDQRLPNKIYSIVQENINKITKSNLKKQLGNVSSSGTTYFTWKTLYLTNILYHNVANTDIKSIDYKSATSVQTVFGSLDNPYTSNKIIIAIRKEQYIPSTSNCTHVITFPLDKTIKSKDLEDAYKNPAKYNANIQTIAQWKASKGKDVGFNTANAWFVKIITNKTPGYSYMKQGAIKVTNTQDFSISELISSNSIQRTVDSLAESEDRYIFSSEMLYDYRYVTVQHRGGGVTKLICLLINKKRQSIDKTANILNANNQSIKNGSSIWNSVVAIIKNTTSTAYPPFFKQCRKSIEEYYRKNGAVLQGQHENVYENAVTSLWKNDTLCSFVEKFYNDLKKAIPTLMAYRYNTQIFSKMTNGFGKSIVDYTDPENTMIVKSLPIMQIKDAMNVFSKSYGNGQFNSNGSNFSYQNCVIDLNPQTTDVELAEELKFDGWGQKFPVRFVNDVSNFDDYKTDKILLTRIDGISAKNTNTSFMGSSSDYYDAVTDKTKLDMKDAESIITSSQNSTANVTLTNGGSYQKNDEFYDTILDPSDQTEYPDGTSIDKKKKKYFRNKYFFIDPFELTIAQWCHAHDKHTQSDARVYLAGKCSEMETSYWKYMFVFEQDKFKDDYESNYSNDTVDLSKHNRDYYIGRMVDKHVYNPLEDTRPYYYATYSDVRGTTQVYKPVSGSNGSRYVINQSNGDEFQMNDRTSTTSFMDILNHKAVYKTIPREYSVDAVDGGDVFNSEAAIKYKDDNKDDENKKDGEFVAGKAAGLNFDLPTEAQWEFCCRAGSTTAIPPNSNLGQLFEESDSNLDLIAWYKYKIVGTQPEPERFCAWRASRFIFGISRDLEQLNHVYEPIDWSR